MALHPRMPPRGACLIAFLHLALIGCGKTNDATGLTSRELDGEEVSVLSAEPDTVTVDTTVTVRITGAGFTDSSTATWLIDTVTAPGIRTLATSYISPTVLEARITVAPDAALRTYRIRVRTKKGKQGIGAERFRVVAKPIALPVPGVNSRAFDVNDSGVIVGYSQDASGAALAVRWSPADTGWNYTILGSGSAVAVNNHGLIVRRDYNIVARSYRSWIHLPSGGVVDLGPVYVTGISNNGTLIGWVFDATFNPIAMAWMQNSATTWGAPQPLQIPPGYNRAELHDINAAGDITGTAYTDTTGVGFVWRYNNGQWQTPERVDPQLLAGATAINDVGALAGWMLPCAWYTPVCYSSPAFWPSLRASRQILPTLYNSRGGVADMNSANQIVGSAVVHYNDGSGPLAAFVWHAVIWFAGGQLPEDLGAIQPWHAGEAVAINNHGVVVGAINTSPLKWQATVWILRGNLTTTAPSLAPQRH